MRYKSLVEVLFVVAPLQQGEDAQDHARHGEQYPPFRTAEIEPGLISMINVLDPHLYQEEHQAEYLADDAEGIAQVQYGAGDEEDPGEHQQLGAGHDAQYQ